MSERSSTARPAAERAEPREQKLRLLKKEGNSRASSRSSSQSASRESTPRPLPPRPSNQYTRERLMQLRLSPLCKKRPASIPDEIPDVIRDEPLGLEDITCGCEVESWYRHLRHVQDLDSRANSPLNVPPTDRKRFPDDDNAFKRRTGREEEEESGGIVLGPQRKSFGHGCHVTTSLSRRNDSPKDTPERDGLRSRGRIGSGRISVDHERDRSFRDRESRDTYSRESGYPGGREGGYREGREGYNTGGRGEGARRFERADSRYDKEGRFSRHYDDREDSRRDYGDRRYDSRRGNSHHSQHAAPEPEWFTSGPSSQTDTIELVGFEGDTTHDTEHGHREEKQQTGVCDRNGSLETNASSSPEHSQHSEDGRPLPTDTATQEQGGGGGEGFDLNDIFIKNIPGLSEFMTDREAPAPTEGGIGSRFSQWFQPGSRGSTSRENSRRSSINEDFSYLHDMLNGSKSPVIPSPPLTSQHLTLYPSHHPAPHAPPLPPNMETAKQHSLLELLGSKGVIVSQQHSVTSVTTQQGVVSVSDVEASLKALLLLGSKRSQPEQTIKNIPNLVIQGGGKVTTLAELEEGLKCRQDRKPAIKQEAGGGAEAGSPQQDMAAFNKLLGMVKASGEGQDPLSHSTQQPVTNISRRDMIQKILLQQQQQQAKAQQAAAVKQLQQQQLQQLLSRQQAGGGKSPVPPPGNISLYPPAPQATVSPRCPSPLLQPPVSPRAPSPIMFGSQPPMHLTAPSPIHASSALPGNPNTLQVSGSGNSNPALARVPSPQELIVHTQAIMQNALIKRLLEEQKEKYIKRQQAKSPNPAVSSATSGGGTPTVSQATQPENLAIEGGKQEATPATTKQAEETENNTSVASNLTSTPAPTKASVIPAFTPTSVIRKMVTEKVDETKQEKAAPALRIVKEEEVSSDTDKQQTQVPASGRPTRAPVVQMLSNIPQQQQQPTYTQTQTQVQPQIQQQPQQPSVGPGHGNGVSGGVSLPSVGPGSGLPGPLVGSTQNPATVVNASQPGRPILKGGSSENSPLSPPAPPPFTAVTSAAHNPAHRPIVGAANQQPVLSAPQQPQVSMETLRMLEQQRLQAQFAGGPAPRGRPITGRRASGPANHPPGPAPLLQNQALLMQKMMHSVAAPNPAVQMQQLAALQMLQQQAPPPQSGRLMDPRLATSQPLPPNSHPPPPQGGRPIYGAASVPHSSYMPASQAPVRDAPAAVGRPILAAGGPGLSTEGGNLARFFGQDLLKQHTNAMPPLPNQGGAQRVMTLEEIERRQQAVTN